MNLRDQGIFVRLIPLPRGVKGVTIPNCDNTFDVYINSNLSDQSKRKALDHELRHIKFDHFYKPYENIVIEEMTANQ